MEFVGCPQVMPTVVNVDPSGFSDHDDAGWQYVRDEAFQPTEDGTAFETVAE